MIFPDRVNLLSQDLTGCVRSVSLVEVGAKAKRERKAENRHKRVNQRSLLGYYEKEIHSPLVSSEPWNLNHTRVWWSGYYEARSTMVSVLCGAWVLWRRCCALSSFLCLLLKNTQLLHVT